MELILLRHEAAEEADGHITDFERKLTKEGRENIKKAAKGLRHILKDCDKICILSSPLARAVQTAEYVAKALKIKDIQKVRGIGQGSLELLQEEIEELDEETCVIIIGHEPDISSWCHRICNVNLGFGKGSAAGIRLDSINPSITGKLIWFAESGVLKTIGKSYEHD